MQMWEWDHFTFLRPSPPPVPPTGVSFPRGLFWADAEPALESADDNHYVGRLLFELLVLAQVICFALSFLLMSRPVRCDTGRLESFKRFSRRAAQDLRHDWNVGNPKLSENRQSGDEQL